jgi:hypothetical protein
MNRLEEMLSSNSQAGLELLERRLESVSGQPACNRVRWQLGIVVNHYSNVMLWLGNDCVVVQYTIS